MPKGSGSRGPREKWEQKVDLYLKRSIVGGSIFQETGEGPWGPFEASRGSERPLGACKGHEGPLKAS